MEHWEIVFFFLVIALVYSSVGFGGGSSYLALLAMYSLPYQEVRLTALICNVIVVTGSVILYAGKKQTDWKKIIPITLLSVPMAYLGATVKISESTFFRVLGVTLIIAALLLWMKTEVNRTEETTGVESGTVKNSVLGGAIGFLSGMVGIGGGIFLSPLLNLMKWDTPGKIAATSSVFILVNSISGITGQLMSLSGDIHYTQTGWLCLAVFAGGQIGSRMSLKWDPLIIKRVTALLVLIAGVNVLIKYW